MSDQRSSQSIVEACEGASDATDAAIEAIQRGEIVVLPTDTVYGIAASAFDATALKAIFAVKNRPYDRHVAVLVADRLQAASLIETSRLFDALAAAFWPGPLTLVATRRPDAVTAVGDDTSVGVRCPDHWFVREVAKKVGPLATTSANTHGDSSPPTAAAVADILPMIGLIVDGGICDGEASTVVDVRTASPLVIRDGPISQADIDEVLGLTKLPQPGVSMRIAVGSDHAGFHMKQDIADHLRGRGHVVIDCGTNSTERVDYPDFGAAVGREVASGGADGGVCVCGSGIGICIAANKIRGVRAATVHDATSAKLSRQHNDANVICLGERLTGPAVAIDAVDAWLDATFEGGRHVGRVAKLDALGGERV